MRRKEVQETEEEAVVILDLQDENQTTENDRNLDFPKMRILHIYDKAGVAGLLAKYQRLLGHEAIVITQKGVHSYGHGITYSVNEIGLTPHKF
jgi:hypothetical protein